MNAPRQLRSVGQEEPETDEMLAGRGGNGGGTHERLRAIEDRLTRLETKFDTELKHLATRAWVLGGVVGGMVIAASLAIAFVKLFG